MEQLLYYRYKNEIERNENEKQQVAFTKEQIRNKNKTYSMCALLFVLEQTMHFQRTEIFL